MSQSVLPISPEREYGPPDAAASVSEVSEDILGAIYDDDGVERMRMRADVSKIDRIVVINDFSVARGGCTSLALLSSTLFRQLGVPVTYICGDDGDLQLTVQGIETVALGGDDILVGAPVQSLVKGLHNSAANALIARWIDAHDTGRTFYHVHGWSKILSPAIFPALARVSDRTVVHAHDFFLACPNGVFYHFSEQKTCDRRPFSLGCIASQCDKRNYAHKLWRTTRLARLRSFLLQEQAPFRRLFLIHERMRQRFEQCGYPPEALHALRNPVIPYTDERVRAEDNSEFFFIGRLEPEKGVEDAAEAAVRADIKLTLIGDGSLAKRLARYGRNVDLVGWQSHGEIAKRVRTARAVLMPSRIAEPFGLVAAEASMSGIPVILSDKAYLADEMVGAGIGLACDTLNSDAFAATLRRLADMPRPEIQAMSEKAFGRTVKLATTPEEWCDALIDHYRSLVECEDFK